MDEIVDNLFRRKEHEKLKCSLQKLYAILGYLNLNNITTFQEFHNTRLMLQASIIKSSESTFRYFDLLLIKLVLKYSINPFLILRKISCYIKYLYPNHLFRDSLLKANPYKKSSAVTVNFSVHTSRSYQLRIKQCITDF